MSRLYLTNNYFFCWSASSFLTPHTANCKHKALQWSPVLVIGFFYIISSKVAEHKRWHSTTKASVCLNSNKRWEGICNRLQCNRITPETHCLQFTGQEEGHHLDQAKLPEEDRLCGCSGKCRLPCWSWFSFSQLGTMSIRDVLLRWTVDVVPLGDFWHDYFEAEGVTWIFEVWPTPIYTEGGTGCDEGWLDLPQQGEQAQASGSAPQAEERWEYIWKESSSLKKWDLVC